MSARLVAIQVVGGESIAAVRAAAAGDAAWSHRVLAAARRRFDEAVLLATCERCELYGMRRGVLPLGAEVGVGATARASGESGAAERSLLPGETQTLDGSAAAAHLLRVAAGLESRMVGETHVLGQVAAALTHADSLGASGPLLRSLFAAACRTGRRVRRETPLGRLAGSYATAAVERVEEWIGDDSDAAVGVLGSGAVAAQVAQQLAAGASRCRGPIRVFARHPARTVDALAASRIEVVDLDVLPQHLPRLTALVAATSSPRTLLHPEHVHAAMAARSAQARPLLLVDLGMPPNVDPAVSTISGVVALWLADLAGPRLAHEAIVAAETIVEIELERVLGRLGRSESALHGATPATVGLRFVSDRRTASPCVNSRGREVA